MTENAVANDAANPLLQDWEGPFGVPPFGQIRTEHFRPAFAQALALHRAEVAAIGKDLAAPTFENTIAALEKSGRALARVSNVFHVLVGADTSDALMAIERDIAPLLAEHWTALYLDGALFSRVDALFVDRARLGLTPEQMRVLERYHLNFRREGAALSAEARHRLAEISERLAGLATSFSQNVLADERAYALPLESEEDFAGLPDFAVAAARAAAEERGLPGPVVTLARSLVEPFLTFSRRRDLREKVFRAWTARGDGGGATDNKAVIAEMIAVRDERARLLGYDSFAHFRLDDTMAKTPEAVRGLLDAVWKPARRRVLEERDALQDLARQEGGNFRLEPWDWRHYAEKLRRAKHDLDETAIKPYFRLDNMIEAAFFTANRLFGLTFEARADVPVYHPDVRVWEVRDAGGRHVGLFFGDYFARSGKRSGAWMTNLRDQHKLAGEVRPLVLNVMNFLKGGEGEPALLSFNDAVTLFHEFGHALHGLLSDVTYPMISGTGVLRDFVELPSQLFEHWLEQPQVLRKFALHADTGEPMPEDLLKRLLDARTFNQGAATSEYLSSAFVDLDFHLDRAATDAGRVEAATRVAMDMPDEIMLRHRPPHFLHIFAGDDYAAGYYSYMWSEVLDADAFEAFEETGDVFDPGTAKRLRDHILAAGGTREPADAYRAFRGRMPAIDALLKKRGLAPAAA